MASALLRNDNLTVDYLVIVVVGFRELLPPAYGQVFPRDLRQHAHVLKDAVLDGATFERGLRFAGSLAVAGEGYGRQRLVVVHLQTASGRLAPNVVLCAKNNTV